MVLGALVYPIRALDSNYAPLIGTLPSLLHSFAISCLLLSTRIGLQLAGDVLLLAVWVGLAIALETQQIAGSRLENLYNGTFDPLDIVATILGALLSLVITRSLFNLNPRSKRNSK